MTALAHERLSSGVNANEVRFRPLIAPTSAGHLGRSNRAKNGLQAMTRITHCNSPYYARPKSNRDLPILPIFPAGVPPNRNTQILLLNMSDHTNNDNPPALTASHRRTRARLVLSG